MEKNFDEEHQINVAVGYNHIGLVFDIIQDYKNAIKFHKCSLNILEKELTVSVCAVYNRIALSYCLYGDYENALKYLDIFSIIVKGNLKKFI